MRLRRRTGAVDPSQAVQQRSHVRTMILSCAFLTVAMLFSPAAHLLIFAYPAMAFFAAWYAFPRSRGAYIAITCWLWFLSPFLRRYAEFRGGGSDSAMLLAPFLATLVPSLFMVGSLSTLVTRRTAPLLYVLGGIAYGTVISLSGFHFFGIAQSLLNWIAPLVFALFLYQERMVIHALYRSYEKAFILATLVVGLYGIYQFFYLPAWDALWMLNSDLKSIGLPEAQQVRVFSTMNAPQILAAFLVGGLLISFKSHSRLRFIAAPVGFVALLLTNSRSAWISLILGAVYLSFHVTARQRKQLVMIAFGCCIGLVVALQIPATGDLINARLSTFSDVKGDSSYSARVSDYGTVARFIAESPYGMGIAADNPAAENAGGASAIAEQHDSSIVSVLVSLGWLGTLAFLVGLGFLAADIFFGGKSDGGEILTARAILIALAFDSILNSVFVGPIAFLVWSCIGFCIAQRQEESEMASAARQPAAAYASPLHDAVPSHS